MHMEYEISGKVMQAVTLKLTSGETVVTQAGGMTWMTDNFRMETNMSGGLFGGLKRAFSGESMFLTRYTCAGYEGQIAFSAGFPGNIVPLHLRPGQQVVCQKGAFLCSEDTVKLDMHFRKKLAGGLFGGEGFILQTLTGPGLAFLEIDGEVIERNLEPGEVIKVDTGHVAIFEPSVSFDVEMVKGLSNWFFGGEYFFAVLRGPGRVWLQTMPVINLAQKIIPFIPDHSN